MSTLEPGSPRAANGECFCLWPFVDGVSRRGISSLFGAACTEVILEVGDAIYYEDDVVHTARGASDEPTVVLGTLVLTTGAPLLMPANMDMSTTTT